MRDLLVIGGGIAGQSVCEAVRERDPEVELTLVCGEPRLPYDRVSLSSLLAADADAASLQLRPDEWYADRSVDVRLGRRAVVLETDAGTCRLEDGEELAFDRCVLATGSDPLVPPLAGIEREGVHVFRGPEDCAAILAAAGRAR